MEMLFLLVIGVFFAPLVLSILAFSRANRAMREVEELRAGRRTPAPPASMTQPHPAPSNSIAEPLGPVESPRIKSAPKPPPPPPRPPATPPRPDKPDMELALGGRVASFIGAAAILVAIAFFVGYAIQHGLLGPLPRVLLSAAAAVALLIAGYTFHRKDMRHAALAQALTGAGAALLYFTVFAAHRLYHFLGAGPALAGLIASAAGVLMLARRYDSQAVAVLGAIGAYVTPWLVDAHARAGHFPLLYVMFVNVPVLALYRSRPWHALPNLAALFAILHLFVSFAPGDVDGPWPATLYLIALYAGLAGLNVVSMHRPRRADIRDFDLFRLTLAAAAFGIQLSRLFAEHATWASAGGPLFVAGLAHALVAARLARRASAEPEPVAFAHIAALFVGAAIWARFEGLLVYALWGLAGFLLAAIPFARSRPSLLALALAFGLFGLGGVVLDLPDREPSAGCLFLNARFGTGLLLALLIAGQAQFRKGNTRPWLDALALASAVGVGCADALSRLDFANPALGLITSGVLLLGGIVGLRASAGSPVRGFAILLLALIPFKTILIDAPAAWSWIEGRPAFQNDVFWYRLVFIGAAAWFLARAGFGGVALPLAGVSSAILIIALELLRIRSDWAHTAVSVWLGLAAFIAVGIGFRARSRAIRYYGLTLFGVAVVKVFLVDLAGLRGLERAGAFLATGLLLLALSYIYQRLSASISFSQSKSQSQSSSQSQSHPTA